MITTLGLSGAVLLGALTQRVTGTGFALVAAPLFVLLLGPLQGVALVNLFSIGTALSIYLGRVREVEYRETVRLLIPAALAVPPGVLVAYLLPSSWLLLLTGALALGILAFGLYARRLPFASGRHARILAGASSGFMNVMAGMSGPPVVAYAHATAWPHRRFAVSVQFYFVFLGLISFGVRGIFPALSTMQWIAAGCALAAGLLGGNLLARRLSAELASRATILVAAGGSIAVLVRGVLELVQ